jgi:hypothetical protein
MILTPDLEEIQKRTHVLRDRVLVKPLPYVHPILITPGIEIQKGVIVAVGYGRRQRKLVRFDSDASHLSTAKATYFEDGEETGLVAPMQVKPGDVVEFSFRNIEIVDFDRVGFPGIGPLVFVWQKAIYSVDPDESLNECLLWQQSAGYDRNGNFMSGAEDWHRV